MPPTSSKSPFSWKKLVARIFELILAPLFVAVVGAYLLKAERFDPGRTKDPTATTTSATASVTAQIPQVSDTSQPGKTATDTAALAFTDTALPAPPAPINTALPAETATPQSQNFLEIVINGEKRVYQSEEMAYTGLSWEVLFYSDKYNKDNDSFTIKLPAAIAQGEKLQIVNSTDEIKQIEELGREYGVDYSDKAGRRYYSFEFRPTTYFNIFIKKWEGAGGMVCGTIEGKALLSDVDVMNLTDGQFCVHIHDKSY